MNQEQIRARLNRRQQLPSHPLPPRFEESQLQTNDQRSKAAESVVQWANDFSRKWLSVIGPLYPHRQKGRSRRGWTVPTK